MATMTLLDRLKGVLHGDDASDAVLADGSWAYPRGGGFTADSHAFAHAMRTWGTVFGVAYGLARMDDPCESAESVGKRALDAARSWYEDYHAGPLRWPEGNSERKAA